MLDAYKTKSRVLADSMPSARKRTATATGRHKSETFARCMPDHFKKPSTPGTQREYSGDNSTFARVLPPHLKSVRAIHNAKSTPQTPLTNIPTFSWFQHLPKGTECTNCENSQRSARKSNSQSYSRGSTRKPPPLSLGMMNSRRSSRPHIQRWNWDDPTSPK